VFYLCGANSTSESQTLGEGVVAMMGKVAKSKINIHDVLRHCEKACYINNAFAHLIDKILKYINICNICSLVSTYNVIKNFDVV
jgi:hypothetical protein